MKITQQLGFQMAQSFVNANDLKKLSKHVWHLSKTGQTNTDTQCPFSESFYARDDEIFSNWQSSMTNKVSELFKKDLAPTYSYARIYKKGETLKRHIDREACEYSLSVTLETSDNTTWPFYIDAKDGKSYQCNAEPGDAIFYEGSRPHWRERCEKDWHIQAFIHFVDINNKYNNHTHDKLTVNPINNNEEEINCWSYVSEEDRIPDEICDYYLKEYKKNNLKQAKVGGKKEVINKDIRNVKNIELPTYTGIPAYLIAAITDANNQVWNFNIEHFNQSEYLCYSKGNKYEKHTDLSWHGYHHEKTRKLTAITVLNDDYEGGNFYIETANGKFYPEVKKGSIIVFPSFSLHGLEPVNKGHRHCVVAWATGPAFK